ncbi:MAG: CoA transferase [Solirubrobacterales bacterium]
MTASLAGTRVIDAATNIAGPFAASTLADLGADVIKLEPLRGDPMRAYPPVGDGVQTQYAAVNHSKRYLALDLRRPQGRDVLGRLLADADVLIQNLRPGHEARLGLDAATVHAVNPRVVHASVAAFHPADGDRPGYDLLVQGESGLMDQTGEPDRPPSRIGAAAVDHVTGLWMALAILAELGGERRSATVRVSMLDVAVGLLNEKVSAFMATGEAPPRMGSGTSVTTPHGAFATADGYVVIGAATDESFARLAAVLGPPLDGDERLLTQAGRLAHRGEMERRISQALAARGTDEWLAELAAAGVPVGRVAGLEEVTRRHRSDSATGFRPVEGVGAFEVLAPPVSFGEKRWPPLPAPRDPGGDGVEILAELGFDEAALAGLRSAGVIP